MPRIVRENQTVRPAGVPSEARFSYFRGCTLEGSFGTRDMSWCDFVDCAMTGDFSQARMLRAQSFQTNWDGAQLPPVVHSTSHDMVTALMQQKRAGAPADVQEALDFIVAHLRASYASSWRTVLEARRSHPNYNPEVRAPKFLQFVFGDYPRIASRLAIEMQTLLAGNTTVHQPDDVHLLVIGIDPEPGRVTPDRWPDALREAGFARDRWRMARAAETWLTQQRGDLGPWRAACMAVGPWSNFRVAPASYWEDWREEEAEE